MAGGFDSATVRRWRERLGRFDDCVRQDGGMTVEGFCRDEGISQSSFYNWRRKLARSKKRTPSARKRQKKNVPANGRGAFEPVVIAMATTAMATTATVHVRLPGDILIEVPAGSENALRTIVDQLVRNEREADQC